MIDACNAPGGRGDRGTLLEAGDHMTDASDVAMRKVNERELKRDTSPGELRIAEAALRMNHGEAR